MGNSRTKKKLFAKGGITGPAGPPGLGDIASNGSVDFTAAENWTLAGNTITVDPATPQIVMDDGGTAAAQVDLTAGTSELVLSNLTSSITAAAGTVPSISFFTASPANTTVFKVSKTTLSAAQIKTLDTVSVSIAPAVPNYTLIPITAVFRLIYGTVAFDSPGDLFISSDPASVLFSYNLRLCAAAPLMNSSSFVARFSDGDFNNNLVIGSTLVNTDLYLTCNQASTVGDSTAEVILYYMEVYTP